MPKFITFLNKDINVDKISYISYNTNNEDVWQINIHTVDGSVATEQFSTKDDAVKRRNNIRKQIDNSEELDNVY